MLLVRAESHTKYGKGAQLGKLFKGGQKLFDEITYARILTDASGTFFTVVAEEEAENSTV
jgi:hypothetical protein